MKALQANYVKVRMPYKARRHRREAKRKWKVVSEAMLSLELNFLIDLFSDNTEIKYKHLYDHYLELWNKWLKYLEKVGHLDMIWVDEYYFHERYKPIETE